MLRFFKSKKFRNSLLTFYLVTFIGKLFVQDYINIAYLCLAPLFIYIIGLFVTLYLKDKSKMIRL